MELDSNTNTYNYADKYSGTDDDYEKKSVKNGNASKQIIDNRHG